jgi:hypothetical protein
MRIFLAESRTACTEDTTLFSDHTYPQKVHLFPETYASIEKQTALAASKAAEFATIPFEDKVALCPQPWLLTSRIKSPRTMFWLAVTSTLSAEYRLCVERERARRYKLEQDEADAIEREYERQSDHEWRVSRHMRC